MAEQETHYCGVETYPARLHQDPEPAEYCEAEVEEEGQLCPRHGDTEPDWDQIRKDRQEEQARDHDY